MHTRVRRAWFLAVFLALGGQCFAQTNSTAFTLAQEGMKFLPASPRNALIKLYSAKSVGKLAPTTWYMDYRDPSVAFKTTELKFVAGRLLKTTHPKSPVQLVLGVRPFGSRTMKVDSDRALAIAMQLPELKNIPLRADQMGLVTRPTDLLWRIRFWMTRSDDPAKMKNIGVVYISAKDGSVVMNQLKHDLLTLTPS